MKPIFSCIFALFLLLLHQANAQQGYEIRIDGPATIINSITLSVQGKNLRLAGINEAITRALGYDLMAQQALSDLIGGQDVACVVQGGGKAQCFNGRGRDLALSLLQTGYAFIDRPYLAGKDFKNAYEKAGRDAQIRGTGLWAQIKGAPAEEGSHAFSMQDFVDSQGFITLLVAVIAGPLIGMLLVAWILFLMLGRLIKLQKHQMAGHLRQEKAMKDRERFVLAAALEGEIATNIAKLDAFMIIYEEMLKNLKDPSKTPKYKGGGDVVHEKPTLLRSVYDANLDKLDLLGTQIVADLTQLYVHIDSSPDYITLEPDMPIEQVIAIVQKIVNDARTIREPMDQIAAGLGVTVRDKTLATGKA